MMKLVMMILLAALHAMASPDTLTLRDALLKVSPKYLDSDLALQHARGAMFASKVTGMRFELLSSVPYEESRYKLDVISRKECIHKSCHRHSTSWASSDKPKNFYGPYFCGALQVEGHHSWNDCQYLVNHVPANYLKGAFELVKWSKDPHCRKKKGDEKMTCALLGYGGGYKLIKSGNSTYPVRCISRAKIIIKVFNRLKASKTRKYET